VQLEKDRQLAIAQDAKKNPKKFWRFVKSKTTLKVGIADLRTKDDTAQDISVKDDQGKAELLSKYFAGVFTQETEVN